MVNILTFYISIFWEQSWRTVITCENTFFLVEYYHNNRVEDSDGRAAVTTTVHTTRVINANGTSAVTMQPAYTPFRVVQPNAASGPSVVTQQPFPPAPAVQTSHGGINPSVYPPPIYHADGTVQKLEVWIDFDLTLSILSGFCLNFVLVYMYMTPFFIMLKTSR